MGNDAFRYDFAGKKLKCFLFGKKICPKCNGKLLQSKGYETVDGSTFNSRTESFFIPNPKVKHYVYYFNCEDCGAEFTLSELAK